MLFILPFTVVYFREHNAIKYNSDSVMEARFLGLISVKKCCDFNYIDDVMFGWQLPWKILQTSIKSI